MIAKFRVLFPYLNAIIDNIKDSMMNDPGYLQRV